MVLVETFAKLAMFVLLENVKFLVPQAKQIAVEVASISKAIVHTVEHAVTPALQA